MKSDVVGVRRRTDKHGSRRKRRGKKETGALNEVFSHTREEGLSQRGHCPPATKKTQCHLVMVFGLYKTRKGTERKTRRKQKQRKREN